MLTRHRERDDRRGTTVVYRDTTDSGQPTYPPYNNDLVSPVSTVGSLKTIDDVVHKNFARRKAAGEILMGDLSICTISRSITEGLMSGRVSEWKESLSRHGDLIYEVENATGGLITDFGNQYHSSMFSAALIKAYAAMKQSDIMGGEVLSDLDKSIGMLHRPFGNARSLLQKMNKRKRQFLGRANSLTKAASSAWLEYRYGWQPIILDAQTIIKNSNEFHSKLGRRLVARASVGDHWNVTKTFSDVVLTGGFYWPRVVSGTLSSDETCSAHAGVIYDVANRTTTEQLQKILGGRSTDLLPLVWEKIPYSFVADWFVNVGDWLQAVQPDPFTSVVASWCSVKRMCVVKTSANVVCYPTAQSPLSGSCGDSTRTWDTFYRTVNPSVPSLPIVTARSLSRLHTVDAVSLVARSVIDGLSRFFHTR